MAKQLAAITDHLRAFIGAQHIFFVGTAAPDGRVNVSPKGMDSLRVLGPTQVAWLNVTGSGNEAAAHLLQLPRMTVMFCALQGPPLILRLYGTAHMIQPGDAEWDEFAALFPPLPGARQVYVMDVNLVQTSCGMAVPLMEYQNDRDDLNGWATTKGPVGLEEYRQLKNATSIDGLPTGLPAHADPSS